MSDLSYDVVALSFPVVYTIDGDHDPNGMLYTLRAYLPLLEWARARWEEEAFDPPDDVDIAQGSLPALHERRQMIELVVDGLARYELMREQLSARHPDELHLLGDFGGADAEGARLDFDARQPPHDTRSKAIRQNLRTTVDELVLALETLTDGQVRGLSQDPATRLRWAQEWQVALGLADRAIAGWFERLENDPARRFDADRLAAQSGLSPERVARLLLNDHVGDVEGLGERTPHFDRFNPMRPIPLVRPLVLRARAGDYVDVRFENQIRGRRVGLHVQTDGLGGTGGQGVRFGDGAAVGTNPDTTVPYKGKRRYRWRCAREGVWPINDLADVRGTQQGTNVHGLFGALIVEPPGTTWLDPETGDDLTGKPYGDGLYVDIIVPGEQPGTDRHRDFVDFHVDDEPRSHREFAIFFHDEPEIHSGMHLVGEHSVMPLSYRAEPMPNRLPHRMRRLAAQTSPEPAHDQVGIDFSAVMRELDDELNEVFRTARTPEGVFLDRVAGEEQHHSSWLFGDPVTPILRAYKGDPARVRLLHAGVKETHVFHLHVHQWRAVPQDTAAPSAWRPGEPRGSQLLDSITIGPQTAMTIDPLYGSGSRQQAVGDVIWHCHLYPHFHHGMWGLWRSFDRLVDGTAAYPDGTPSHALNPLPGREPLPRTAQQPGFPWFIDAAFPQKSPPPPAIRDEDMGGRRTLLRMPKHSAKELDAFAPGCLANPQPGALFVDLDGDALQWNDEAGLAPPRIISYEVQASADDVRYNDDGWHDPRGHHYSITGVQVTQLDEAGEPQDVRRHAPPAPSVEAFYPRANHGDVVELRFHNELESFPADDFDLAAPAVECGLHVHLVKFDVLAADGSATGWNYLSGASCREAVGPDLAGAPPRNTSLHRWVVDEEFGPCFFHDHLLANYRQEHGLFAALIAEPPGSQWHLEDQERVAWSGPQAVVVLHADSGMAPYREACLAIADFVPLYREDGKPLNTPHELGGDDDPGAMAVNYACAPLTHRGEDPSEWFSSRGALPHAENGAAPPVAEPVRTGDPETPVIRTYPGERLRIRLVQGSHEEQHSFVTHGLRWRSDWHNPSSRLVNQQTIGISEVFTLDIGPAGGSPYGPGDHLWQFAAMDDLWLGCWGIVRALMPTPQNLLELPPLPDLSHPPHEALQVLRQTRATPPRPHRLGEEWSAPVREHVVVARRREIHYAGQALTDPWGLVFEKAEGWRDELDEHDEPTGHRRARSVQSTGEPLVLRARRGEWVHVTLINEVLTTEGVQNPRLLPFAVEPSPPPLPIEPLDDFGYPSERSVSPRVSLHPSLLLLDVVSDDGANVGHNHDGTVGTLDVKLNGHGGHAGSGPVITRQAHGLSHAERNWREYWWYADEELAPASHADGPGQVCHLQDMADVRNHRHHGLIGALVVEPGDCTPVDLATGDEKWWGTDAHLRDPNDSIVAHEKVLLLQDGLRHFVAGNPDLPVRDVVPDDDAEDAGQKGINYLCALVGREEGLRVAEPGAPIWRAQKGDKLWLRVVCAADKPRNHTFTLHGHAWRAAPWVTDGPWTGALSGLSAGTVHDLVLRAREPGDHAFRSGVFRWAVEQGLWGLLRVEE